MANTRTKMATRVAERHLRSKTAMTRTAGEVRFIKDRGGDEKNWAYADTGPSQREMNVEFKFAPGKLKPLARCLRSALMALGHTQSSYHEFAKIKSAIVSPDGNLGGKGYIQEIKAMRRQFMNCSEALSSLTDTLYDEINAPHWAMENPQVDRQRDDVKEIMDDVEDIRDNPEAAADVADEDQFGKTARRKQARRKTAGRVNIPSLVKQVGRGMAMFEEAHRAGSLSDAATALSGVAYDLHVLMTDTVHGNTAAKKGFYEAHGALDRASSKRGLAFDAESLFGKTASLPRGRANLIGYFYALHDQLEKEFNYSAEQIQQMSVSDLKRSVDRLSRGLEDDIVEHAKRVAPAAYKQLSRMSGGKLAQTAVSRVLSRSNGRSK